MKDFLSIIRVQVLDYQMTQQDCHVLLSFINTLTNIIVYHSSTALSRLLAVFLHAFGSLVWTTFFQLDLYCIFQTRGRDIRPRSRKHSDFVYIMIKTIVRYPHPPVNQEHKPFIAINFLLFSKLKWPFYVCVVDTRATLYPPDGLSHKLVSRSRNVPKIFYFDLFQCFLESSALCSSFHYSQSVISNDEYTTPVYSRCLYGGRQFVPYTPRWLPSLTGSGTTQFYKNQLTAAQQLYTSLRKSAISGARAAGGDAFKPIADLPKSEPCSSPRIVLFRSAPPARLDSTVSKQIAIVTVLIEHAVERLFDNAKRDK